MPERSALTQGVQVGVETTPGTGVAANKSLSTIGIEPSVSVDMQVFRPMGQKYAGVVTPGKEWVEADIEGRGSYTELVYLLSSILTTTTPTTVETSGRLWTFTPASKAEDTVKTLTVEQGGSVRAHKFTYGLCTELSLSFDRDGVEIGGAMIGQALQDNIVLTSSPTAIEERIILPTEVDVFIDPTSGALGTTKLLRVLSAEWSLGDRFNPLWVLNSAQNSFVAHVEAEPSAQVTLTLEADAQAMALLTTMRAGATQFIRIKATAPAPFAGATAAPYFLQLDQAVKVSEVGDFSDEDGVYAIELTFDMVHDATWGKALQVAVQNKVTAL
jgi:hypothetical protein